MNQSEWNTQRDARTERSAVLTADAAAYLTELRQRLASLPVTPEDVTDAVLYYEEYFVEAGPEHARDVIAELGSPAYVAAQIALKLSTAPEPLRERKRAPEYPYTGRGTSKTEKKSARKELRGHASYSKMLILGIAAAPVALPLAIAAAAVMVSLLIAAAAMVFSLGIGGVACIAAGIASIVYSAVSLTNDFATALFFAGAGLFSFGVGGFLFRFSAWFSIVCFRGTTRLGGRLLRRSARTAPDTVFTAAHDTRNPHEPEQQSNGPAHL